MRLIAIQQEIVDYVTESRENLDLALHIADTILEIKKSVISKFVDRLEGELKKQFNGAEILYGGDKKLQYGERWSGLYIRVAQWPLDYMLGLQTSSESCDHLRIGVCKPEGSHPIVGLKQQLDENFRPGKSDEWWEWWVDLDEDIRDWNKTETLLRLYPNDREGAIVEGVMSRLVSCYRKIFDLANPLLASAARN